MLFLIPVPCVVVSCTLSVVVPASMLFPSLSTVRTLTASTVMLAGGVFSSVMFGLRGFGGSVRSTDTLAWCVLTCSVVPALPIEPPLLKCTRWNVLLMSVWLVR